MNAEGMCRTGCGHYRNDSEVLRGVMATDHQDQEHETSQRWNLVDRPCGECAAKSRRCFHRQPSIDRTWETPEDHEGEYEIR